MERSEGARKSCLHREVQFTNCMRQVACSCMTRWETTRGALWLLCLLVFVCLLKFNLRCNCMSTWLGLGQFDLACLQLHWNFEYVRRMLPGGWLVGGSALHAAPKYASQGFQCHIGSAIPRPLLLYARSPECTTLVQGKG